MRHRRPLKQRTLQSDAVIAEPRWRLMFRCFGDRSQAHKFIDHRKPLKASLTPRRDTASLTSYEVSSSSPLLNHPTQPKQKSALNCTPRSDTTPRNSIVTKSVANVAYKQLHELLYKRESDGDDIYRDADAASTCFGFVLVKNDADQTTVSGLTTPAEMQSLCERLGANQAKTPQEKQRDVAPVGRAVYPVERHHGSSTTTARASQTKLPSAMSLPKSTANAMALKPLYHCRDVRSAAASRGVNTQCSSRARPLKQHGTNGHVCWV